MAEDRGTDVADTSGSYGGYNEGRDQGGWVGDAMDFTTFGQIVNALNALGRNTVAAGGPVGSPGSSRGDGYGNNEAMSGSAEGASAGYSDNNYQSIIDTLINATKPPKRESIQPNGTVRGGTEGGRRPSGGSMRRQYMPAYQGVSAGRGRQRQTEQLPDGVYLNPHPPGSDGGIAYAGGSRDFDERTGQRRPGAPPLGPNQKRYEDGTPVGGYTDFRPGGNSINNTSTDPLSGIRNMFGNIDGLMEAQSGNNALSALGSFTDEANRIAADRAAPMTGYLSKLLSRGDIASDSSSINAAAAPRLQKGRNNALASIMQGNRVSDNLYDTTGLGAEIGGIQGAQNVDVRGRIPSRTRRY